MNRSRGGPQEYDNIWDSKKRITKYPERPTHRKLLGEKHTVDWGTDPSIVHRTGCSGLDCGLLHGILELNGILRKGRIRWMAKQCHSIVILKLLKTK